MSSIDYFPELKLPVLKGCAQIWSKRYPIIRKIILYRGSKPDKPFNLLFEIPEDSDPQDPEYNRFFMRWCFAGLHEEFSNSPEARELMNASNDKFLYIMEFTKKWEIHTRNVQNIELRMPLSLPGLAIEIDEHIILESEEILYEKKTSDKSCEKKLLPAQKHRMECRKVAKKLLNKEPSITIAAAIRHRDMIDVSKKKNGSSYTEKTVRNWIKNLFPDRRPGRRKGT